MSSPPPQTPPPPSLPNHTDTPLPPLDPLHLPDIAILQILPNLMLLHQVPHQRRHVLANRIPLPMAPTQITRKPRPLPMTLDQEPRPDLIRPDLHHLHHLPPLLPLQRHLGLDPPRPTHRPQPGPTRRTPLPVQHRPLPPLHVHRHRTEKRSVLGQPPPPPTGRDRRPIAVRPLNPQHLGRRRDPPQHPGPGPRGGWSRLNHHPPILLPQRAHRPVAREFRRVKQPPDVRGAAGAEGLFEHGDDGALEGDDLRLELELGLDCFPVSTSFVWGRGIGGGVPSPSANRGPNCARWASYSRWMAGGPEARERRRSGEGSWREEERERPSRPWCLS